VVRPWLVKTIGPESALFPSVAPKPWRGPAKDAPPNGYSSGGYRKAIDAGCRRAGVDRIAPNRLRKLAATTIRRADDLEGARVILGHADGGTTAAHYASVDLDRAERVAAQLG
jgi:integrase